MAFKATKYQIKDGENNSSGKSGFKATKYRRYDPDVVSGWETTNKQSLDIINDYNNRINKSEWLDKEDRAKYRSALDSYIETSNALRGINKTFGEGYTDEDEQKWADSIASMNKGYEGINSFYGQFASDKVYGDWMAQKEADDAYNAKFSDIDVEKASQGWQKYLDDEEVKKNAPKYDLNNDGKDAWWEKALGYLAGSGGGVVDTTLPNAGVTQTIHDLKADNSHQRPNESWSEEQRNVFGQLYAESPYLAYNFAEETNKRNNKAKEEAAIKEIQESATSSFGAGLGHTIGAIAAAPLKMADFLGNLAYANAGREITDDGSITPGEYSDAVIGGISTHLNEYGTLNESVPIIGGKGWGDVYGLGTSIAQSMASAYTLGSAGTLVSYFGQGAASAMESAMARGVDEGWAGLYGVTIGAIEGAAESMGIDNLFKLGSASTLKGLLKNVVKQAGAEGLEEGVTAILSNIADAWMLQDKSEFAYQIAAYQNEGLSESDAKWKVFWDSIEGIAFDTIAGAASGSVSGGIHSGVQTAVVNADAKKNYSGQVEGLLIDAASVEGAGKTVDKLVDKYGKTGELSGWDINHLLEITDSAKVKSAVEAQLTKLGESGDVSKLADVITKQAQGMELSKKEQALIDGSTYGQRIVNTLDRENIKSGMYDTKWAKGIGTRRLNADVYNKSLYDIAEDTANAVREAENATVTENALVKESAVDGKFEASVVVRNAEGKTVTTEIQSVEVDGDKASFTLANGERVDRDNVAFKNENERFVADIAVEKVSRVEGFSNEAATAMIKGYDGSISPTQYTMAFDDAFKMGASGVPSSKLTRVINSGVSERVAYTAYELGRQSAENVESVLNSMSENGIINTNESEAQNESGENVHLRNGGKRDGSKNTQGQVSRMEEGTGQAKSRGKASQVADSEAARLVNEGREIKVADLGILGGSKEQTVRVVDKANETTSMKEARKLAEERGLKVTFFTGDNLVIKDKGGEWISARAYIKGDHVFVRADHSHYTADQLMRHELGHDMIAKGEVDIDEVRERLTQTVGKENIDRVAELYSDAYAGTGMSAEEIWEECICDSLGDMNIFAGNEDIGTFLGTMLPEISAAASESKAPTQTRGSPEGKASREIIDNYTLTDEFLREVPYRMREAFARSLANKTSGMVEGEVRTIYVVGYIFEADGYMHGRILAPYNEKTKKLLEVKESGYDEINEDGEIASVWTEAVQDAERGSRGDSGVSRRGRSSADDRLLSETSERYASGDNERVRATPRTEEEYHEIVNKAREMYGLEPVDYGKQGKASRELDAENTNSTEYKINTSMTMAEAKRMIETAFKVNGIAEYYEGEYEDAEDWLKKAGSDEVEMYIENDFDLQEKYISSNEDILNEEYRISDVLDAYLAGTLIGKEKPKPKRLDVSKSTRIKDSRFYSPQKIEDAKATFEIANQKAAGKDANAVNRARAEILLFAHNKGAAGLLGVTQAELNKKLRSWSRYSATAKNISERINAGVAEENRWTGIENSAYISKARVTEEDIERLVSYVEGDSKGYERRYIARVMLAADTHIDYSGLKFKFASSQQVNADNNSGGNSGGRVLGFYDDTNRLIEVTHDKPNTVAHEMGHYIDAQWGRDLVGSNSSHLFLTRGVNADIVRERYGEQGVQFLNNFKLFVNSLSDVNSNYNSYYNDRGEIFARFFARFIEWTDNIATGNKYYSYESTMYGDKFTQAQYVEFARLLQEKALLDGTIKETGQRGKASRELNTERVSYAPTFYSHMGKVIDDVKLEKMGTSSILNHLKNRGVKDEEIKWSGIEAFLEGKKSVTKAELQEFVAGSQLQIEEEMSGRDIELRYDHSTDSYTVYDANGEVIDTYTYDADRGGYTSENDDEVYEYASDLENEMRYIHGIENAPRHSGYKLEGGANYREIVFKMPNSTYSNNAMKGHWGQDAEGVLAHARIQDFEVDGKKMLFVEEIQSDWHNEGAKEGYADLKDETRIKDLEGKADEAFFKVEDYSTELTGNAGEWEEIEKTEKGAKLLREHREARRAYNDALDEFFTKVPDAPFRNNYHEYVLKRLLRMAAEEGYDSIGWTTADIQSERWSSDYAEGYRIEYDQDIPKFLRKYGKKWGATVGKTAIEGNGITTYTDEYDTYFKSIREWVDFETERISRLEGSDYSGRLTVKEDGNVLSLVDKQTGHVFYNKLTVDDGNVDVWSMDITDAMKESVLYEGQPKYSRELDLIDYINENADGEERKPITNREILANALETAAQNDIERQKLQQYKQKIDLINAEEQKLAGLRAQIKELSFAKGKRDTEAIKNLQFEANQAANRINTYDKQLLNLESTKALKGVLEREKALARKRDAQKYKEAQERYREKAAKTQRELMDRYQESRKKATEGRNKTAMRYKIKGIVSELNTLLLKPTAKKHIKEELRREVAEALSAINMDTVGADERVAMYNALIAKEKNPDVIAELTKTRDRIQLQGDSLKEKLGNLQSAYEKIKNTDDIELNLAYQEVIQNSIKAVSEKIGNTSIRNMTLEQLEMVYDLFSMIRKTVRDANKSFKEKKGQTIMQMAEAVNDQVRTVGGQPYKRNAISAEIQRAGWTFLKPFVAFRTIGSITLTNMYKELRNGEDTFYGDVKEAQAFIEAQYKKHGYKSWDMKKTKTFTAKSGKSFDLTLEQMMSLYAYSKRDQAHDHIIQGGIVFEDALVTEKNKWGVPIKYEVTTKDAFNLSEETFTEIASSLTAEQKAFVDEMQAYLSDTMGAKGNEVSMELLGVKLFKEKFYLPIKSSQYYMNFKAEEAGEVKLKSPAFSKETVQHANNPIVVHNFTDLWAEHINDMSMYHSFVLALEDFTRVYNYKTKTDAKVETMDTKATLETAYPGVTNYINKFLKDMNGGVRGETVGWAEKLTSLSKKGSVLGSASVTIQQPSAVMRAMAYISPKYFVTTAHQSINLAKHKADWAELKQYAPIAGIKEMGRFDVGMGQGTVDWIKSDKTVLEKGEDILSMPPAFMDEVTWLTIWNAVKRETVHNNPGLATSSEEFLKLAGERFTEVISLSQVYDSVFSRSDLMRNKSWIAKSLTAFMAEPSTTLNMLWDSYVQGKRTGSAKGFVKSTATVGSSIVAATVFNAALKSIIMAMRDDDEDESYAEKYLEHFVGDLKDSLNPLGLIPFVKDILSIFQGYDVERMDMAMFSDLKKAIDAFDSDSKTLYDKWSGLIGAISAFFGVPVKNVERDVRGLITTIFGETEETTVEGMLNAIKEGWTGKETSKSKQLYNAYLKGDKEQIKRIEGRFKDQSAIDTALRKALRENDPRVREAAEAYLGGDYATYNNLRDEIAGEGNFSRQIVTDALKAEYNYLKKAEENE